MKKAVVKIVQQALKDLGHYSGRIDGLRGGKTDRAVAKALAGRTGELDADWQGWSKKRKAVTFFQLLCRRKGIDSGKIDGFWGSQTEFAYESILALNKTGSINLIAGKGEMESLLQVSDILLFGVEVDDIKVGATEPEGKELTDRKGKNRQLAEQFSSDSRFARICAFSHEGAFYELPWPALFLVHDDGEKPSKQEIISLSVADIELAVDLKYWSYDKADYTIRMDVETGRFEQVLLDAMFAGGVAGANVRGANVRGANVRGGGGGD